jgi:hypothetical protein
MLKNLTVRKFLTVIFFAKKNIAKKSAKIRLLFIFLSILYLTTKTDGFLTVRKSGSQLRDTKHISQKNSLPAAVKRLLCCLSILEKEKKNE